MVDFIKLSRCAIDITDKVFGELTVLGPTSRRTFPRGAQHLYWLCRCSCGVEKEINSQSLRIGASTQCGHRSEEIGRARGKANVRHGETDKTEHRLWGSMLSRCRNGLKNYGERGITVCERWEVFENFLADMGRRPSTQHTLERIDNDKGYSPDNCRWATMVEQNRNKRTNVVVEYKGRKGALSSFFEDGAEDPFYDRVLSRLHNGWPVIKAFEEPINPNLARRRNGTR